MGRLHTARSESAVGGQGVHTRPSKIPPARFLLRVHRRAVPLHIFRDFSRRRGSLLLEGAAYLPADVLSRRNFSRTPSRRREKQRRPRSRYHRAAEFLRTRRGVVRVTFDEMVRGLQRAKGSL